MSRIEKNQPVMEEMEEMKGEIMGAVKRKPGRGRWYHYVMLAMVAGFLALFAWAAWTLAATGLVTVPVLSRWAYDIPVPTRVVGEGVPFETVVQQQVAEEAMRRAYAGGAASDLALTISETTLTTELRDSLETSGQTFADPDGSQVAVLSGSGIELFLPLRDTDQQTAVKALLRVTVTDGVPKVTAETVSLGSWQVGAWLREGLVNPMLDGLLDTVVREVEGSVTVTSVREEEGSLIVNVTVP